MGDENLPTVVSEAEMEVMGVKIRVLVLDNGQRVVPAEDAERFFAAIAQADGGIVG